MNLFTKTEIGDNPAKIHHNDRILTIGSCFGEHIGQKLQSNKFKTLSNPFGIVYNPGSISSCLNRMNVNSSIKANELQLCQDYYCHPDFHSQFNGIDKQATLESINQEINATSAFVNEGLDWLFISLGTAFVYHQKSNNQIVNNCHKLPASNFTRRMLHASEIKNVLSESIEALRQNSPSLKVILTVSPIRHIRDGLTSNLRSKSRLIEAAHTLTENITDCYYFPSYEILIDELRDYRWYKEDLIHPNDQAINYIWESFKKFGIGSESLALIEKMDQLHRNLAHKPFLAESEQYQKFLESTLVKIETLEKEYEQLDFDEEKLRLEALSS